MNGNRVSFDFRQKKFDSGLYAVEKDSGGVKRRYLEGIASGIYVDGHGERMTQHCIESFQQQAKSGDILLYEGLHGVNFIDDIGTLVDSEITPNGEWHVSFRLYDEADGVGPNKLERVNDVWKQAVGLPPYKKPKVRGFSIEGDIPEGGIKSVDESGRRVMDDVKLDGVVLVNRPAYQASMAHGVYKALGELPPWIVRKSLKGALESKLEAASAKEEYWQKYYQLQDALDSEIKRVMSGEVDVPALLEELFREYSALAIDLILKYPQMYEMDREVVPDSQSVQKTKSRAMSVLKDLESNMRLLVEIRKSQEKHYETGNHRPESARA
jgi:hypothetical protein